MKLEPSYQLTNVACNKGLNDKKFEMTDKQLEQQLIAEELLIHTDTSSHTIN